MQRTRTLRGTRYLPPAGRGLVSTLFPCAGAELGWRVAWAGVAAARKPPVE